MVSSTSKNSHVESALFINDRRLLRKSYSTLQVESTSAEMGSSILFRYVRDESDDAMPLTHSMATHVETIKFIEEMVIRKTLEEIVSVESFCISLRLCMAGVSVCRQRHP